MGSRFQENNPYIIYMIRNFNTYSKFHRGYSNRPKFITWSYSSIRASKMMYCISCVYKFRQKSSLWHRRAITCREKLEKVQIKRETLWDDRFYLLQKSFNQYKLTPPNPSLFDIVGLYVTTNLNCYTRDFKNKKRTSTNWKDTYYKIERSLSMNHSILDIEGWSTSYKRSFRGFLLHDDEWDIRFQGMVDYWNHNF